MLFMIKIGSVKTEHGQLLVKKSNEEQLRFFSVDPSPENRIFFYGNSDEFPESIHNSAPYGRCFAEDTMIRTITGEEKRACDIIIGDRLPTYSGNKLSVVDIISGFEKDIYNIKTVDGNNIRVTCYHVIKVYDQTDINGKDVQARELKSGDLLMTKNGTTEVSCVTVEPYNGIVYNYIFKDNDPNYLEANGYWTGDFYAQNQRSSRRVVSDEELAVLREDMKKIVQGLS